MNCIAWLIDSDPAIRWQAMRDLTDASPATIAAERARVPHAGLGAEILSLQKPDGSWSRAGKPTWLATLFTLLFLRAAGIDRAEPAVESAVGRLSGLRWDNPNDRWDLRSGTLGGNPFFDGEVEPCINGGVLALGGYFGRPSHRLARRLIGEQLEDGGWNCEAPKSARSSFHTTLCVLEGLLEYERAAGAAAEIAAARLLDGAAKSTCCGAASSAGLPPAKSRTPRSWSSPSRRVTTTTFSARSTISGTLLSNLTRASVMLCK